MAEIVERLKLGQTPYEFDFKSFFNKVNPLAAALTLADPLIDLVKCLLLNVSYSFDEIKEENELVTMYGQKDQIVRFGLPQGLSISPILATKFLEISDLNLGGSSSKAEITMYADDGIEWVKGKPLQ